MMKAILFRAFLFSLFLSVLGCAQNVVPISPPSYSVETERSFEEIERAELMEKYRKMRQQDWSNYTNGTNTRAREYAKQVIQRGRKKAATKSRPSRPPLSDEQLRDLEIEVEQRVTYYCMKKRNDPRFKTEEACLEYAMNTRGDCQESGTWPPVDRSLVECLKKKLK
jgi:hypothetical protein